MEKGIVITKAFFDCVDYAPQNDFVKKFCEKCYLSPKVIYYLYIKR